MAPSLTSGSSSTASQLAGVFSRKLEIRKDRGFPLNGSDRATSAWAIYIDNLMEEEIWCEEEADCRMGVPLRPCDTLGCATTSGLCQASPPKTRCESLTALDWESEPKAALVGATRRVDTFIG